MQQKQIVTSPRKIPADLSSLFFMASIPEKEVTDLRIQLYRDKYDCNKKDCKRRGHIQYCLLSLSGKPSYLNCPEYSLKR